ncbi:MAG: DUF5662 family protein [Oscillospiraceae bacterium]|nr:DUF5662 family protein [Oscillospiraceae bacterium]
MTGCWGHFKTILKHKWYVFIECCKMGIPLRGLTHDLSKFSPAEFIPSARYFQGNRSPIEAERETVGYSRAWLNHKSKNKHHWQYWLDNGGTDKNGAVKWTPVPMPDKYIKEMYCDMVGAAKAYGGVTSAKGYYLSKRSGWLVHPETKDKFERMLGLSDSR